MAYIKIKPLGSNDEEIIDGTLLYRISVIKDKENKIVKAYLYCGNDEFVIDSEATKQLEEFINLQIGLIDLTKNYDKNWDKMICVNNKNFNRNV